jgi:hypothetical protein
VAEVVPVGIVRELGADATLELVVPNVTVNPPVGAGPFRVIVPTPEAPPIREEGIVKLLIPLGSTVTVVDSLEVPLTARMVTVVAFRTE